MLNTRRENKKTLPWESDITPEHGGAKIASIIEVIFNLYISDH